MEQGTRFFTSGGFFNNIGSNVREGMLDEIAEWMIATKCECYDAEFNHLTFNTIDEVKKILVIGDDKKLHYKLSSYYSYLKFHITGTEKTPGFPSSLVIGKNICVELTFDEVLQDKLDEWKGRLSDVYISRLVLNKCTIDNWDWINDVASIRELALDHTSIPNGFEGFKRKVNYFIRIRECDIKNLDNFPSMTSDTDVNIVSCPKLSDISGLADRNKYFNLLNIDNCANITCTKNLSELYIKKLYIQDNIMWRIFQNGDLFGSVTKYITIWYDCDEVDDLVKKVNEKYPWAYTIATKK